MRYRVGRHNPQLVYAQSGDDPDPKADNLVAVCFTSEMAAVVVEALTGRLMLGTLASAAEAYLTRTEADDAVRAQLRVALFDATTDAWLLLRPNVLQQPVEGSTPIASPAPAAEPVPVPPPVDALLKLVDEFGREAHAYGLGDDSFGDTMTDSWKEINSRVRALWAAGVEEGRREDERALMQALMERDDYEEIADKLTSAVGRHLGVDMGEHSNANSPWENALNALDEADGGKFVKGAYEAGVTEGRRQATEERTEEQQGDDRG